MTSQPAVGKGSKIIEFDLSITLLEFIELFWDDWKYHEEFVEKVVYETILSKDEWKNDNNDAANNKSNKKLSFSREINTNHPLPISLPWLPVYVTNNLHQNIKVSYCDDNNNDNNNEDNNFLYVEILEKSNVQGIPLVDPKVCTHWLLKEFVDECDEHMLNIKIHLYFEESNPFNIITPLVELHSKNELISYYNYWKESANFYIIELENDKIFTDSESTEKKVSNNSYNRNNQNPNLNEVYDIIHKMQASNSLKLQKRRLTITDTDRSGSLCFSKSNSSLFNSCASEQEQNKNQGGFFQFFNFFCS
jgi:hypothetical protein